jgi:NitT/TauT family transport system substrate-binding protein
MRISPRIARFAAFLALSAAVWSCSGPSKEAPRPLALYDATLRLKWVFDPGFGGELVAAKKGFFAENGVKVAIRPGGFESDPIRTVAAGADTFGVAGADSFLLARAKGIPIVAIAAGYLRTPVVFYVHGDSSIKTPKDFVGKRVGYQAGQDTATVYEAVLEANGVDRKRIREVPIKFDFTPFISKRLDVWPGYAASQSYTLQQRALPYRTIVPAEFGVDYLGTVYFTTERFLKENPKIVEGFVKAIIRGWQSVYERQDEAVRLIGEYDTATLTPDMVRFTLERQLSQIRPEGTQYCVFTDAMWASTAAVLKRQHLLPAEFDLAGSYVTTFLDR